MWSSGCRYGEMMDLGMAEEDRVRILVTAVEARMLFEPLLGKHFADFHNELPVR